MQSAEVSRRDTNTEVEEVGEVREDDNEQKDEDIDREVLFDVLSAIEDSDPEEALIETSSRRERKFKNDKYKKLLTLSNVYTDLYLAAITREYETIMNLSVLAEELKHKYLQWVSFKRSRLIIIESSKI